MWFFKVFVKTLVSLPGHNAIANKYGKSLDREEVIAKTFHLLMDIASKNVQSGMNDR